MNILMISDVYFPRVNGVSTSIATFRGSLAALGHSVMLIAPDYPTAADEDAGIVRIPSRYLLLDPEDRILKAGEILSQEHQLRDRRFDLLHIQTPFIAHHVGVKLARRLGIPCVETYHTYFEEYLYHYIPFLPKPFLKSVARSLTRRQCNHVDHVVVPSRAMHEVLDDYGVRAPVSVIPTGIEPGDLPAALIQTLEDAQSRENQQTITHNEEQLIRTVLEESGWNKTAAAGKLGISRSTLWRRMKEYGLA